jgi:hypothetical protein
MGTKAEVSHGWGKMEEDKFPAADTAVNKVPRSGTQAVAFFVPGSPGAKIIFCHLLLSVAEQFGGWARFFAARSSVLLFH